MGFGAMLGLVATLWAFAASEDLRRVVGAWLLVVLPFFLGVQLVGFAILVRSRLILRRARRAAYMLCDNCLYPINTPECRTCPECGADLSLVVQRWPSGA